MRKIFLLFFIYLLSSSHSFSNDEVLKSLKEGNKLVFIRHALAPGSGDPENFDINTCSTQRNLNNVGIEQSKKIGSIFKINKIKIDEIYSSEWCRCKDTAKYAFKHFKTFDALNSFYDISFSANEDKQIKDFNNFIKTIVNLFYSSGNNIEESSSESTS